MEGEFEDFDEFMAPLVEQADKVTFSILAEFFYFGGNFFVFWREKRYTVEYSSTVYTVEYTS